MPKNVVLCFDGTSNEPADAVQEHSHAGGIEDQNITNVLKLHLLLGGDLAGGSRFPDQRCFYHPGVGTYGSKVRRIFNAAFAPDHLDVGRIIRAGLADLQEAYEPGDRVFVFGFSRGAAIARRFVAVLPKHLGDAAPRVRFVGVFDTVASIGKPNLDDDEKPVSDVVFENGTISSMIDEALHLVSLDDARKAFLPTLMNADDRVTEIWMPGVHSDVGGGYREDGLSDLALQVLLDEFRRRDLGLRVLSPADVDFDAVVPSEADYDIDLDDLELQPDPLGKGHFQRRLPLSTRLTLTTREPRVNVDDRPSERAPLVHWSVAERIHHDADYRPRALRRVRHELLHPDGTREVFDGLRQHLRSGTRSLAPLAIDEQRELVCSSYQRHNPTGIALEAGGQYLFEVPAGQTWQDGSIACGPEGWTLDQVKLGWKELAIAAVQWRRRKRDANWFALIGAVGHSDDELFEVLDHTDVPYVPKRTDELCTFANDLPTRYGNNAGSLRFVVRRVG
jgi:hypothetical protein